MLASPLETLVRHVFLVILLALAPKINVILFEDICHCLNEVVLAMLSFIDAAYQVRNLTYFCCYPGDVI